MSQLIRVIEDLRGLQGELHKLDTFVKKHPENPSLLLDYHSLEKHQKVLETQFQELAQTEQIDICNYRLITDGEIIYPVLAMSSALNTFQELITSIFDAVKNGPKKRYRPSAEIVQESSLGFAYAYSGSLGFALTIPNQRYLLIESELDQAIDYAFEIIEAKTSEDVSRLVENVGIASIKKLYDWSKVHADYSLSADIKWRHKDEVRTELLVQPDQLRELCEVLERKSDDSVTKHTLRGRLVGLDIDLKTFHLSFPESEDIKGKLSEEFFEAGGPSLVPGDYSFNLERHESIFYSTKKDEVFWILISTETI